MYFSFLIFIHLPFSWDIFDVFRAAGRSKNRVVSVLLKSAPTMVKIGLTYLPKSEGAMALPAPRGQQAWNSYFESTKIQETYSA
jgi:hypothetical protein